jgi:hypothetical protein
MQTIECSAGYVENRFDMKHPIDTDDNQLNKGGLPVTEWAGSFPPWDSQGPKHPTGVPPSSGTTNYFYGELPKNPQNTGQNLHNSLPENCLEEK